MNEVTEPLIYALGPYDGRFIKIGPGQRSWYNERIKMGTQTSGKSVREANKRNGVGRPPRNKVDPTGND